MSNTCFAKFDDKSGFGSLTPPPLVVVVEAPPTTKTTARILQYNRRVCSESTARSRTHLKPKRAMQASRVQEQVKPGRDVRIAEQLIAFIEDLATSNKQHEYM